MNDKRRMEMAKNKPHLFFQNGAWLSFQKLNNGKIYRCPIGKKITEREKEILKNSWLMFYCAQPPICFIKEARK